MKHKIFVDGQEGTTGLKINDYLKDRDDIEILKIDPAKRKDLFARAELINSADIVFLCLPDEAAKESFSLLKNSKTKFIDASTAFRTADSWTYGLPELGAAQRELVSNSSRVSNPGCHATGFILALYPLIKAGIVSPDYPVTCFSLTGYSGGGRKLISRYEENAWKGDKNIPRHYALKLAHKHLPEMQKYAGLSYPPLFTPVAGNFYKGMAVSIPLILRLLVKSVSAEDIRNFLASHFYNEPFVNVLPFNGDACLEDGFFVPEGCNDTNRVDICVSGDKDRALLLVRFDNLGKGASGAAVQNMNLMLGIEETTGLKA